ncbi:MAG: metalloregulator ArsR/SmtB family transcription factor [Nitrospinaceae bacterium]|nr:winged helix-turn-helix transcriptional regulator [Nitrospinaceae bacterium]NIR55940.1 winged helix-turn-helix transcriptional regulator [Nitrospinaceae bacterium]NIT83220.1 winged helix-turn-helix transcriptional regulator [Nitrospinaceae bacterium]NIX35588.1 metalloregulator ArsR/SmtB family transcription factor [Nitrospinaceae bacterium]NIY16544.1 metalloregulator ArsR/SmtB family transcription factor [Nitrospinaceae bacterium]
MFETLQAMAEPTRLDILRLVQKQEMPAGEIAQQFKGITRPAVSQHLRVLKDAGLVDERRQGTRRLYRLRPEGFAPLKALLEDFWDDRLSRLKAAAEQTEKRQQ